MSRSAATLAGSAVAAYRVERLVGRGGMGEVYRARDERLGRPVALKVLAPALAADDGFRARLLRESRLAASLDHPNVVPIYEAGDADGRLFIAMRFVDGPDLGQVMRAGGALEPPAAVAIAAQVADALDAAHRRGLVHRDVKPSNVLLDREDGRNHAYLADFGLTRSVHGSGPSDPSLAGTVGYLAPELIRGDEASAASDQYALGCLLFQALTGTPPFRNASDVATIFSHLEEPPPAARARRGSLPAALDPVLGRALAKDPADRFASCGEFVAAARAALGLADVAARRSRLVPALAVAAVALAAATAGAVLALGGDEPAAARPAGALVRIDPATNQVAATVRVPGTPGSVAVSRGGIWTADFRGGVLWRHDPATSALQRVPSQGEPRDLAALGDDVYVAADGNSLEGTVARYDASTGARRDSIDLLACAMAAGEGVVWAAGCPFVDRLSAGAGPLRKLAEVFLPFTSPGTASDSRVQFREMTLGAGSLWVLGDALDRRMWRLDARTGAILATMRLPIAPRSVAIAAGTAWVTDPLRDTVVPVDIGTGAAGRPIPIGRGASGIVAAAGAVWAASALDGTVARIDPRRRRVVATVRVGGAPVELDAGRGGVWVATDAR